LAQRGSHVIHVAGDNYYIMEDANQSLIHCLTQYVKARKLG
jgi:D-sedoheptulose 7-phosphate isomerase